MLLLAGIMGVLLASSFVVFGDEGDVVTGGSGADDVYISANEDPDDIVQFLDFDPDLDRIVIMHDDPIGEIEIAENGNLNTISVDGIPVAEVPASIMIMPSDIEIQPHPSTPVE